MGRVTWAAGVDLGGTKIQIIQVNTFGTIGERVKIATDVTGGPDAITQQIVDAIGEMSDKIGSEPAAVGVGVAGQIDADSGVVKFAPNLKWENVLLQQDIKRAIGVPVIVTNDVRAATWGEWLHGAGKGAKNLLCVFIGTGVGGGIVSDSKMLSGYNNTAGEIGHITVSLDGPQCTCGNKGCVEAYAGGWALAKRAQEAVTLSPQKGKRLVDNAGGDISRITGKMVMEAGAAGDALASQVVEQAVEAIAAGVSGLVNSISPEKIIFGGGVIEGSPYLIDKIAPLIHKRTLDAAFEGVEIIRAKLHNDAGAIGAGALAIRLFVK
ncbi:MAG: ROK family protein [Chlamydiota bacterium]|nr:ROK family protein [Chlamydiota bacterium]